MLHLLQAKVAADICNIFNAPNHSKAEEFLREATKYQNTASKLVDWMENNIPEGLTIFSFTAAYQRLIRTTNGLERLNREIKRRTRVVSIFTKRMSLFPVGKCHPDGDQR